MNRSRQYTVWKCIVVILFIVIYGYLMSLGFYTSPCESGNTPSHDYRPGFIMLGLFPFLSGGLVYLLFLRPPRFQIKQFLKVTGIAAALLLVIGFMWILVMFPANLIVDKGNRYLYEIDCYNHLLMSDLFLFILYFIAVNIVVWPAYIIAKSCHNKKA